MHISYSRKQDKRPPFRGLAKLNFILTTTLGVIIEVNPPDNDEGRTSTQIYYELNPKAIRLRKFFDHILFRKPRRYEVHLTTKNYPRGMWDLSGHPVHTNELVEVDR